MSSDSVVVMAITIQLEGCGRRPRLQSLRQSRRLAQVQR